MSIRRVIQEAVKRDNVTSKSGNIVAYVEPLGYPHPDSGKFFVHRITRGGTNSFNMGRAFTGDEVDHIKSWASSHDNHTWDPTWKRAFGKLEKGQSVQQSFK